MLEPPPAAFPEDEEAGVESLIREQPVAAEEEEARRQPEEDPVRLYFGEMGRVLLLTARQEVEIGRRIETGQIELRRALGAVPAALSALGEMGDRLRRGGLAAGEVNVPPAGGGGGPSRAPPARLEARDAGVRQAKRELTEANLRLVVSIAKRYLRSGLPLLDLV